MIIFRRARIGSLLFAALLAAGCDGSTTSPVAPEGTVIVVQASPLAISVTGSSTITVTLFHSSGVPAREGTEVLVMTTRGTIETSPVVTDSRGVARTVLRADGRAGTAEVTATSGVKMMGGQTVPNSDTINVTIGGGSDTRLTASFTPVTNDSLTVRFDESSTGNPTSWAWSFGDGAASTQREPTHTYPSAGTYQVTLTVRNADGQDNSTQSVVVPNSEANRPEAMFTPVVTGLRVTFTDNSANNPTSEPYRKFLPDLWPGHSVLPWQEHRSG